MSEPDANASPAPIVPEIPTKSAVVPQPVTEPLAAPEPVPENQVANMPPPPEAVAATVSIPVPAPAPAPEPTPTVATPLLAPIKNLAQQALEKLQFRKKSRLERIIVLAQKKGSIVNDDVEKLLKVSDATASRYLAELVETARLMRSGTTSQTRYEPMVGSNGAI